MLCPKCKSSETSVFDTRDYDSKTIKRRRECEECHFRFSTFEKYEAAKINIQKTDGRIEAYDREKITLGIKLAANHRISDNIIDDIVDSVESKLFEIKEDNIPSKKIGNLVIKQIKKIDEITYLRFASVYKNFKNLDSFEQELIKLKK